MEFTYYTRQRYGLTEMVLANPTQQALLRRLVGTLTLLPTTKQVLEELGHRFTRVFEPEQEEHV